MIRTKFVRGLHQAQTAAGWTKREGEEAAVRRFPVGTKILLATVMSRDGVTSSKVCCISLEDIHKERTAQNLALQVGESVVGSRQWIIRDTKEGEDGG